MKLFENLVLEGGGVKGLAYIGALKALNDTNLIKDIKRVVGTSVGSMFAVFVACKVNNEIIDKYGLSIFNKITEQHDSFFREILNFYESRALHNNTIIYDSINLLLYEIYNIHNMTFSQLYEKTNVELTIVSSCISTESVTYFNHMNYPDLEVAKCVQMSTAIPFFYTPVTFNDTLWVDGGIVDNFPINFYDDCDGNYNDLTLGLYFKSDDDMITQINTSSYLGLIEAIENTQLESNIRQSIGNVNDRNIISINVGKISPIDFKLSYESKKKLIDNGYNAVQEFLKPKSLYDRITSYFY